MSAQLGMFDDPTGPQLPQDFETWWWQYPHKVGKGAARKAWARAVKITTPAKLFNGLNAYKRDKPADRPWCNPATWLNQERWLDQPAGAAPRPTGDNMHVLQSQAELMARGINVASVTTRQVMVMVARGWLTKEQARAHGWDLDDAY